MIGTEESSGRALDRVRMHFRPSSNNKPVTSDAGASMSSDIRQKLKNMNLPQLSGQRSLRWKALQEWEVQHW